VTWDELKNELAGYLNGHGSGERRQLQIIARISGSLGDLVVTCGPFCELSDDLATVAEKCPVFFIDGSVVCV